MSTVSTEEKIWMKATIKTGDTVFHQPTRETWLVAFVEDGRLYWCGWPPGYVDANDCILKKVCTEAERQEVLIDMAKMKHSSDRRRSYARQELGRG